MAVRKPIEPAHSGLDMFVGEQNIARYRELLDATTDEARRKIIIELLVEQVAKLRRA